MNEKNFNIKMMLNKIIINIYFSPYKKIIKQNKLKNTKNGITAYVISVLTGTLPSWSSPIINNKI